MRVLLRLGIMDDMNVTMTSADLLDQDPALVRPLSLTVDGTLTADRARHLVRIGQLLYTFWNTGDRAYFERAVDPAFRDNTLPHGRAQGPSGILDALSAFRNAVPDLRCELSDLLVIGDKLAARLHFTGVFSGSYNGVEGAGQHIDFVAFDIQHVGAGRIFEDWHLEDNLTFLLQAGLATIHQA